eukprot:209776-Rhodomonas_salina.2
MPIAGRAKGVCSAAVGIGVCAAGSIPLLLPRVRLAVSGTELGYARCVALCCASESSSETVKVHQGCCCF